MQKQPKILMVSNLYRPDIFGGAELIVAQLAEGLVEAGHEVAVLTAQMQRIPLVREIINGVRVFKHWPGSIIYPPRNIARLQSLILQAHAHWYDLWNRRTGRFMREVLNEFQPDVVHSHNIYGLSPIIWHVPKTMGVPVVHTAHDSYLMCPKGNLMRNRRSLCKKPALLCRLYQRWYVGQTKNIDVFCTASEDFIEKHRQIGVCAKDYQSVLLTTNSGRPSEPTEHRGDGCLSLLYLGQLEPHKGLDMLLEAFGKLPADADVKLNIAGRGAMEKHIRRATEWDRRIVYHGFVDEAGKQKLFQNSDVLLVPSVCYDSGPLTIMEAFNAALPVVASTSCGHSELVTRSKAGFSFPTGDAAALADIFRKLLDAPQQLQQMKRNASETAKNYSFDKMLALYSEIYSQLT